MSEACVILGGGVAGLSAANRLVDAGVKPLIIDASKYPAHRMCGEFFSYECHPILEKWGIPMTQLISHSHFFCDKKEFSFELPVASGGRSRYEVDKLLLERAKAKGARALIETEVKAIHEGNPYTLELSNGEIIKADQLIIGTGKIPQLTSPLKMKYSGFKAHFEGIKNDSVEIHTFPGGYLGLSNIDPKTTNIACLFDLTIVNPETLLENFMKTKHPQAKMLFPNWLKGKIPEFGIRDTPHLDRVFWIGDAAGSIPPVCGEGLAIATTSGCMAADYYLNSTSEAFKKDWHKRYKKRFFYALLIHKIMTRPRLASAAFLACNLFPRLPLLAWRYTRE